MTKHELEASPVANFPDPPSDPSFSNPRDPGVCPPPRCPYLRQLRRSSDTYRLPSPSAFSASQSASVVVQVGGSLDVSRPSMRPTTSSWVSAISRISRPTSPVKARPTRGGVCRNHLRTPIEEASRRSRASKENVSGPGSVGNRSSRPASRPPQAGPQGLRRRRVGRGSRRSRRRGRRESAAAHRPCC